MITVPSYSKSSVLLIFDGFTHCGFQIPGTEFQSLSVKLGFWSPIVSRIPDSLSCILDSKVQDFGFHKKIFRNSGFHRQKFPGFRNPNSLTLGKTLRHIYSKKYTYCCPLLERPQNPFVWCFEFLFSFVLLYLARFHLHYPQCYRFLRHCSLHRLSSELFSHLWLFYCFLHVLFLFVDQQESIPISFLWQNN